MGAEQELIVDRYAGVTDVDARFGVEQRPHALLDILLGAARIGLIRDAHVVDGDYRDAAALTDMRPALVGRRTAYSTGRESSGR